MITTDSQNSDTAADYSNDEMISKFYRRVWGGSDIHIGRYKTDTETVASASAVRGRSSS